MTIREEKLADPGDVRRVLPEMFQIRTNRSINNRRVTRGFHHHATLCIAAYGFLIAERGALPPSGPSGAPLVPGSTLSCDYRPRGAADPARTARTELDHHHAPPSHRRPRPDATEMPLLQRADPQNPQNARLLTQ
jgi:hypothetical protein